MDVIKSLFQRRPTLKLFILLLVFVCFLSEAAAEWSDANNLNTRRREHTSTLLPNGKVLVAGGYYSYVNLVYHAELYDPDTNTWTGAAEMNVHRNRHAAVLLNNGRVLVSGGMGSAARQTCELYDPIMDQWTPTGDMVVARIRHTLTRLPDGKVLATGGALIADLWSSAEIYDPDTGTWTQINSMNSPRTYHTATLLADGKVLITAGSNNSDNHLESAEIYDPATGNWSFTGNLNQDRNSHIAILLRNGNVLVAGGNGGGVLRHAELYNPATGNWTVTGSMITSRAGFTATMLTNGKILVAGPKDAGTPEIYDPSGTWESTDPLTTVRSMHSAVLLQSGQVLITGGENNIESYLRSAERFDPSTSSWELTGNMNIDRGDTTTTPLSNGKTLVVGGGYRGRTSGLYDPVSGTWTFAGSLNVARHQEHTATYLPDGRVLVTGGWNPDDYQLCSTEIYSPTNDLWTPTDDMNVCRQGHAAILLPDGNVLVAGGRDSSGYVGSAELYAPATGAWSLTANMAYMRAWFTATQLADGRTLVIGGGSNIGNLKNAELYDPDFGIWSDTGNLRFARYSHSATRLRDGRVLVAGGKGSDDGYTVEQLYSAEIYDPINETWLETGSLNVARSGHAAILLPNGDVLIAGGHNGTTSIADVEIYDPDAGAWTVVGYMNIGRSGPSLSFLPNGKILAVGSGDNTTEVFDSGVSFDELWRPVIYTINSPIEMGEALQLTGANFIGSHEASGGSNYQSSATNFPLVWLFSTQTGQSLWLPPDPAAPFTDGTFTSVPISEFSDGLALVTVFSNGIPSIAKNVLINKPPLVKSIVRNDQNPTNADSVDFTVLFSKHVTGVDVDDFQVNELDALHDGQVLQVNGSERTYIVTVSGYEGIGELRLDVIDDDSIQDIYGLTLGGTGSGNGDFTTGEMYTIDRISPILASAAVWLDGLSVDVIFSETMGAEVLISSNYELSGTGQGNMPDNPDQIEHQYDNIYRLIWNPGDPYERREMQHAGDVTITASNVYDAVGNLIGSPDNDTDYGGGVGLAPETTILPSGGTYTDTISVELICDDGEDGSGCAAIYYTTNGEDPTMSSPTYSGPIAIEEYTELKYMAIDNSGNMDGINSQVYHIEKSTSISCNLSTNTITFGEGFTITGTIGNGPPNNPDQGISIELIPSSGATVFLSTNADVNGDFALDVDCDAITHVDSDVGWTVRTSWPGDASHLGATCDSDPLVVGQASSNLTLDVVMGEAVKINSRPPIGGSFSPVPYCGTMDLSNTPIILNATEPNNGPTHTLTAYANQYGQFLLDYDHADGGGEFAFDVLGDWTIKAEYAATTNFAFAETDNVTIRVVPTAGYAIVVQGRVASGEGMPSHHKTASFVYEKLKDRQLLDDDIQYLSWLYSDGWDGDPSRTNIQHAITEWARDKMDENYHPVTGHDEAGQPGDLYIIMVDHGWTDTNDDEEGVFFIHPDDPITSTELAGWVNDLQGNLTGEAANRNIVVILGFCRAAAFMDQLAGSNRVVIASADKHESSHRGPQDVDAEGQPLRDGEYFVSEFFKSVSYGRSIRHSFEQATLLTEAFTSTGSGVTNAPYYDDSVQHPVLNDNGDALGSNELSSVTGEDGAISEFLFIGASPPQGNDPGDVLVTQAAEAQFIGPDPAPGIVDLWAEVDSPADVRLIWLEVKPPNYDPIDPGVGFQIEMANFKKATTDVTDTRYLWNTLGNTPDPSDLFDTPGTYQIFYFAKDDVTGHTSPLMQGRVYRQIDNNNAPGAFDLLMPSDCSDPSCTEELYTTVALDWEDSSDLTDGHSITYTVLLYKELSTDPLVLDDPIRIEGLPYSGCLLGPEDGLQDYSTYHWQVIAVDEYGATQPSESTWVFKINTTNAPAFGWIEGHVYSAWDDTPIKGSTVLIDGVELLTGTGGYYLGIFQSDTYSVQISATGFITRTVPGITISELDITTREFWMGLEDQVAEPYFVTDPGTYNTVIGVELDCTNGGAQIRYTTDGSEPDENSSDYVRGSFIQITETTTIKARAFLDAFTPSNTIEGEFVIDLADGDLSGEGDVDLIDVIMGLQVIAGINPTLDVLLSGDVNGDGKVGLEEIILILQEIATLR